MNWVNCRNAKTIEDCEEIATCDAYDESEVASGWMTCLEEIFENDTIVILADERLVLSSFDIIRDSAIVAVVKMGKRKIKVSLDSIKLVKPTKAQTVCFSN